MNKKQNCTRSRKKLSRIILPDSDSSEEENTANGREDPSAGGHAADKHTQQGQLWASGPSGSVQPKVLCNPAGNQSSGQRLQVLPNIMDAVPGALNVRAQSHNQTKSTSPPCAGVESRKECGNRPVQLKVCKKRKKGAIVDLFKKVDLGCVCVCVLNFILNDSVKEKIVFCM